MALLALVRHGESTWNEQEKFTGWHDVLLTTEGEHQSQLSAAQLSAIKFDIAFGSELTRVKDSLKIVLQTLRQESVPTYYNHALNERDYGDLTGRTHREVIQEFGESQYKRWHRSWGDSPPRGESLKQTYNRVWKYYQDQILPELKKEKNVLVVSSGNCLRALRKGLDNLPEDKIPFLEIPTGTALVYEVDKRGKVKLV
jgi:2,3-bisphosphoglycerate-dependent phosphoglycerate mutase